MESNNMDKPGTNTPDLYSHNENAPSQIPKEFLQKKGIVVGGKYVECLNSDPIYASTYEVSQTFDFDLPPTIAENTIHNEGQCVVLDFLPKDTENPFNWPSKKRAFISLLLCLMTLFIGLATTAYNSGIGSMSKDLGTSELIGKLGLFCFNFTCALAPMFLAPFCELAGRRVIYVGGYVCFNIMFIGLALGKNIATILVCRSLLGLFGCIGTILVGGTFGDMYRPDDRAIPMASFSYVAILGTVGAPIYAGFIDQTIGWRWIEGVQGLASIPLAILIILFLRETRGGVKLSKRAKIVRQQTGDDRFVAPSDVEAPSVKTMLHNSSVKAIKMLMLEPVVLAFGLWISFAWFLTFLFLSVIPITFHEKKGWSEGVSGLPYISLCIGTTLGFALNFLQIRRYNQLRAAGSAQPESRLYGAMFGAVGLPVGLFVYSFTQYAFLHWIGPVIGLALIAIGIFFIFESCYSFTSDCYGENSSSAMAGQGFMRNTLGAVSPLFASQFFHNVGSQYAGLILAVVATGLAMIPYVLFVYGPAIRARSALAAATVAPQCSDNHESSQVDDEEHAKA